MQLLTIAGIGLGAAVVVGFFAPLAIRLGHAIQPRTQTKQRKYDAQAAL
jgi:hypothetical protein